MIILRNHKLNETYLKDQFFPSNVDSYPGELESHCKKSASYIGSDTYPNKTAVVKHCLENQRS